MTRVSLIPAALVYLTTAAAVPIPEGTRLAVRLLDPLQSEASRHPPVRAVLIAPVLVANGIALPAGAELGGEVKSARAAAEKENARLELAFSRISSGGTTAKLDAVVFEVDNAREAVDEKGVILGIDVSQTLSSRLDQGISKLESNDKLAVLAGIIAGAKQTLNIQPANPNIDYPAGTELTLRLTRELDWTGPTMGPEAKIRSFANEPALVNLVLAQPFRTVAANPPRPSDLTNLMFAATESDLRAAFTSAGWTSAARLSAQTGLETARALIEGRGYSEGPMSVLLLDRQPPDFSLQKGNNTFAQRHHLRIFRRPGTLEGKPLWVCSATHDISIDYSDRDHTFIHRIDPEIDRERAKVVNDLLYTGMVQALALVERPAIPENATNATGDVLKTDGRMAVLLLAGPSR